MRAVNEAEMEKARTSARAGRKEGLELRLGVLPEAVVPPDQGVV
jgi:hypothetical protein